MCISACAKGINTTLAAASNSAVRDEWVLWTRRRYFGIPNEGEKFLHNKVRREENVNKGLQNLFLHLQKQMKYYYPF